MSKVSLFGLIVLCAALAACSEKDTNHMVTAPSVGPAFNEAPADFGVGYTAEGPFDVALTTEAQSAQMAASAQAATGSRASGHAGFSSGVPSLGIASEQYSFVALGTDPSTPFAAKGEYEMTLTTTAGRQNKVHGDVICMSTVGNTTRIAGIITKLWVNNVQVPIPTPGPTHNFWTVTDTGEGQGTADAVSLMVYTIAPGAQFHCATGFTPQQFPIQEGNVQVQP